MKLSELIKKSGLTPTQLLLKSDPEIIGITSDSRQVKNGILFVAIKGEGQDGHQYVETALNSGASAVVVNDGFKGAGSVDKTVFFGDTKRALGFLAAAFYDFPAKKMLVIGVTGTSGKTTTTFLIESILREAGLKPGLIGTVEFRINGRSHPSTHTTPGAVELQALLAQMIQAGCKSLVMEVSSHALKQRRVDGMFFDGMAFTNLSRDHLDYHGDFQDYYDSKKLLFTEHIEMSQRAGKNPRLSIYDGSEHGKKLIHEISLNVATALSVTVSITARGIEGSFDGVKIKSPLIGRFNAENILLAASICKRVGISEDAIQKGIESIRLVPGRLEPVEDPKGGRLILVDYAHKPDALEKVLQVLRDIRVPGKKTVTVVGCGGDRDPSKRPIMGEIACRLSDRVVFTTDNPRSEDPEKILKEVVLGCSGFKNYEVVQDRRTAIQRAIALTGRDDIVLIAGKGHEDYQIVGKEKHHFDDREEARAGLAFVE